MTTSEYDAAGRPARITRKHLDTGEHLYTGEVSYDKFNNLKTFSEQVGSERTTFGTTFTHDNENRPTLLNFGSSRQVAYVYDGLGRVSRRSVNAGGTDVATTYGYLAGGHGTNSTTPLVQTITQSGTTLTYAYDDAGNITSVSDGSKTISYEYDLLGQLIRVNDPYDTTASTSGTTWKYAYDLGGNIQSKTAYAFTTGTVGSAVKTDSYTYGDANWKDKLTAFNGASISYDAIGNPTSDGTWSYIWEKGRQLQQISKVGEVVRFVYNEDGLRVQKVAVTTGTTNYTLHGKNIVHMTQGSNSLHFFYDAQDKPAVVLFNGTAYAYLYNLQGDVIGLIDSIGNKVVSYTYDAWGKMLSKTGTLASTLGTIQPFRYRGYVFDEETGLYYLQSRYYNSDLCRFISTDTFEVLLIPHYHFGQYSLYSYCENKPISNADSDGKLSWLAKVAIGVGAILVGAAVVAATAATGGAAAAFAGAVVAGLKSAAVSGAVAAGVSASITTVSSIASGDDINTTAKKALSAAVDGFSSGFMWGGISFGASRAVGYITQKTRIFERKFVYGKNNFMYGQNELTIWRHGKNFRIDASASRGLHYHYRNAVGGISAHRTAGIFEAVGGIAGIASLFD